MKPNTISWHSVQLTVWSLCWGLQPFLPYTINVRTMWDGVELLSAWVGKAADGWFNLKVQQAIRRNRGTKYTNKKSVNDNGLLNCICMFKFLWKKEQFGKILSWLHSLKERWHVEGIVSGLFNHRIHNGDDLLWVVGKLAHLPNNCLIDTFFVQIHSKLVKAHFLTQTAVSRSKTSPNRWRWSIRCLECINILNARRTSFNGENKSLKQQLIYQGNEKQ